MYAQPQKEHEWLQKLVGDWSFEADCVMGPDQPPLKSTGSETVRSLGGLWTLGEGIGQIPDSEETATSIMTLGYDPQKGCFLGSFVTSCMTHLWIYQDGTLDESGKILTLDTEGPSFDDAAVMKRYQDIIEFVDDDYRLLKSQMLGDDGKWVQFMTGHYRRQK